MFPAEIAHHVDDDKRQQTWKRYMNSSQNVNRQHSNSGALTAAAVAIASILFFRGLQMLPLVVEDVIMVVCCYGGGSVICC